MAQDVDRLTKERGLSRLVVQRTTSGNQPLDFNAKDLVRTGEIYDTFGGKSMIFCAFVRSREGSDQAVTNSCSRSPSPLNWSSTHDVLARAVQLRRLEDSRHGNVGKSALGRNV